MQSINVFYTQIIFPFIQKMAASTLRFLNKFKQYTCIDIGNHMKVLVGCHIAQSLKTF